MRFANYGRKSVFSDKSDSIDNQFRMAREYADYHFSGQVECFLQYSDEDFTGANADRPDLQRLIQDIKAGLIDALIVYQLDRLSRNIQDFANIYSILEEHHVKFISVRENIDTTSPIGEAMMYVCIVFAQMERKTTAARVTDNMIGLVKKGFWTAGNPPVGYVRQSVVVNGRNHVTIVPDPEGVEYVKWIFDTFLENRYSLQGMETAFRQKGIRTRTGGFFSSTQIYQIITSPFCAEATGAVYDYYKEMGCIMDADSPREKWDGKYGVMVYGRTTERNKKHQNNPPDKWLVCIGRHQPFLSADIWLTAQRRLRQNIFCKATKYDVPLLKGVLHCSCGSIMQVQRHKLINDRVSSWYYCLRHLRQGKEVCNRSQIKIELLDEKVISIFRSIESDPSVIYKYLETSNDVSAVATPAQISGKISVCESKIGRLASSLALAENSSAAKYILAEMERLDLELQALKREQSIAISNEYQKRIEKKTAAEKTTEISRLIRNFDCFSSVEKNAIVRDIVKSCIWDGERLVLTL